MQGCTQVFVFVVYISQNVFVIDAILSNLPASKLILIYSQIQLVLTTAAFHCSALKIEMK